MSSPPPADGYFRALLESASDIVALVGPEGTIRYVNGAVERTLGWRPEERVGRSTFELVHPDDRPLVSRAFARLAEGPGRAERVSCRLSHRAGGWRNVEATGTSRLDDPVLGGIVITVRDVTRAQRAEEAALEIETRFGQLADNIDAVFWLVDRRGWGVLYVSPAFERVWGRPAADLLADASCLLRDVHPDDRPDAPDPLARFFGDEGEREYRIVRRDGQVRWLRTRSFPVLDDAGAAFRVVGISEDVTERRVRDEMLQRLALRDPLTGLPNRASLLHRIERALERTGHSGDDAFSLLFVDLDRFKLINDSLGHARGDELLRAIALRLEECVRPADMVARLGGDEFGLLLHDAPRPADAARVAERVHAAFAHPFDVGGVSVFAGCSIGVVPSDGYLRAGDVLRDADIAMDRAKRAGRGVYRVFDAAMHDEVVARLQLETDLRHALERNEFRLLYQPVVSVASGEMVGVEALLRWAHPQRGMLSPSAFLEVAEEIGTVVPLGWAAIREAASQLLRWDAAVLGAPPLGMSVNLSALPFHAPGVAAEVRGALEAAGCPPERLRLEITESVLVQGAYAEEAFRELKALGVELHIDDFGTGYSALAYLDRFPVDTVKVDRSLVARVGAGGEGGEIVEAVVRLAHGMGMRVTAEGVETPAQLARLGAMGCDFVQGFLFAPPLPAEEVEALLRGARRW